MKGDIRESWDEHWAHLARPASTFGRISTFVREQILSRAVLSYADRYLPRTGVLVEMGCGSAESSSRIRGNGRRLVALDFSAGALRQATAAGIFGSFVQGDLERLPFGSATIDGAWNLGVLEHFDQEKGIRILAELRRVLKPGGTAVLFWPPAFGSSRLVLAPIEFLRSRLSGRPFAFFPDEVNRLRSRAHARQMLADAGLSAVAVELSARAGFIHLVVVTRRIHEAVKSIPSCQWEIVYVVEGTDGTREVIEGLHGEIPGLRVLYQERPAGLGAAFRKGFEEVAPDADYVVTMDADLNHRPEELSRLLDAAVRRDLDILIGSRFVEGARIDGTPAWKLALSGTMNVVLHWLWGLPVRDKTSGYRVYRASALRRLRHRLDDFAFLPELLILAQRLGMTLGEEPIHFIYRVHGTSKMAISHTIRSYFALLGSRFDR